MDTNVLSTIHLYNLFMPQILKGKGKKVVSISSGMGDMDWVREYDLQTSPLYGASKAALNMIDAKFSAQYKKDGILFLSICPGVVDVGHFNDRKIPPPSQVQM
jgi:NAD(P)-dependent dehydrogenase (short-subunit alcohol dehydrogenase family)